MELIENALEALLTGAPNDTSLAKVEINFDQLAGTITIKDNGCGADLLRLFPVPQPFILYP